MKKRGLSLFMVLVLCLTLLPTAAFAEGEDVSISGGVIGGGETGGEGGGIYVAPGSPTEGGGGTYIPGEDTRTEIRFVTKPYSIERSYDGTTDGSMVSFGTPEFTDGTNTFELTEGTDFTAKKTFDSADAGWHTVTVEIALIGEAATKYKLKSGEETFTIDGYINKAYPELTVSLSKTACTAGEKLLPLLSVEGAPEDAEVTYYYLASALKSWAGSSDVEGSDAMPKINENTAISEPGTYYVYAKSSETTNYEEERSKTVELTVNEPAAASVTKANGTDGGTYTTLPAALNAAQDGDTVKLLADHTTNWSDVEAGEYATLAAVKSRITLDLNGMTVDYLTVGEVVSDEAGGILETYEGNLTVVDNIQGGSHGKIEYLEFVKGSLAIQGGQIGDSNGSRLTCNENSGSVTISGGTVLGLEVGEGDTVTVSGGTVLGLKVNEGAAVTVNGGSAHAGNWFNDGTLSITGGTFKDVQFVNSGTIAISGGTFEKISNNDTNTPQPLMLLLAKDCAFVNENNTSDVQDGTKTSLTEVMVKEHTHSFENGKCDCGVASIVVDNNNSCYNTLQAALNAAANDASITSVTLGQDLTENVTFNRSAAGSLTLNMNGHKLEAEAGVPLTVIGGELIIEGAGQVNQNTASNANPFPAISLTGGKLVITGDLSAQGGYNSSNGRKPAIRAEAEEEGELDLQGNVSLNGGLTILGNTKLTNLLTKGTFYAQDPDGNATKDNVLAVCVQQEDASSDNYNTVLKLIADGYAIYKKDGTVINATTLTLNSDTYSIGAHTCSYTQDAYGLAYCKCGRSHAHRDLSEEKSVLVNGVCPICGYHCPHKNIGNDGVCTDCHAKMVAKVTVGETTTYTADLADALNKAANGTTITLLADIEWGVTSQDRAAITGDGKIVTLNLNGHTITGGWLDVGSYDSPTSCTLKIIGEGSHESLRGIGGYSGVFPKATLDLSEWEGGTISAINISDDSNVEKDNPSAREAAVIVGPKAGTIGKLTFGNNQLGELKKTKLSGGSFNEIWAADFGPVKLGELLAEGYAYQYTDGVDRFVEYTKTLQGESIYNVKVVKCPHKEVNEGTCAYCNATGFAAQVTAADGSSSAYTDIAAAIAAAGGGTVKLLADAGEITISSPLKLDLNGKTAAKLTVTGDVTLASLLPEGYAFKSGSTWISDLSSTELTNVSMAKIPIKSMDYPTEMSMTYGGTGTLLVKVEKETSASAVSFQWYKVEDGKETAVGSATTKNQFDLSAQKLSAGRHTFRFSATCDGYKKMSQDIAVTVQKANISARLITPPTAQGNLTYTGQEQALITAGSVMDYGTMQYSLTENGTYSQDIPAGTDAGAYTVWYRVIGDANHNDTAPASVAVSIGKKPLTITGVTATSKSYDGTTNADISSVTFDGVNWKQGTDYTVTASFDDASVGNGKSVTATVTLMGQTAKNYALEQSSFHTTGSITKAAAPDFTKETALVIVNGHEKTYTVTLPALPTLETPKAYGALTYEIGEIKLNDGYYTGGAKVENGKLTLPIQKNDVGTTGSVGTATVVIKSANYEDITLTVNVNATNKLVPTGEPTLSAKTLTYGQVLSAITLSGKMKDPDTGAEVKGTFEWTDGTIKPDATDSYQAGWKFTPTNQEKYAEVTGTVTIKVNKATPTGAPKYTEITTGGKTLKDAALTIEGSTLKPNAGELEWVDDEGSVLPNDTTVDANKTYKWRFTPTDVNYTVLTGSIELYHRSSGGGGSYIPSYTVSADKTENGTITVSPKSAYKGDTVTFTVKPDKGYEPDTIKVLDQNGDKVKLTEKDGKYTFKMPDSKVEIQATFVKEAEISPFGDVSTDAYYYEAVKWAQKKGITGGIGNDLFGPNQPCTRAQIATFLWRAAGSPEPKNMSSFSDVPTDSYYAKAVAWAVENGITAGTGDGKFSPNTTCTREQAVAFLYRAAGSPAVSGGSAFSDVAANAYYANAVAWAEQNEITGGIGGGLFGSGNDCTRAQIVTFLYRSSQAK